MCTKNVGFGRNLKSPSLDFSHDVTTLAKRGQMGGYNKNKMGTSQINVILLYKHLCYYIRLNSQSLTMIYIFVLCDL